MSLQDNSAPFLVEPGFCGCCGTILPLISDVSSIKCIVCEKHYGPEAYGMMESYYVLNFHSPEEYMDPQCSDTKNDEEMAEGPVIKRKCPKCGNNKMSYATLQLRSADEGQTVFYKCTKCKYKESENS